MPNKIKTILAVDDDPDMLRLLEKILRTAGYNILTCESPEEARKLLDTEAPHLIISDLNMSPESGYTFIHALRKQPIFEGLPIIVLSAVNEFNSVKKVISLGVSDYVIKPLNASILLRKIRKVFFHQEYSRWTPPEGQEPELRIKFGGKILALGETGYDLAGPFKISSGEKIQIKSKELESLKLTSGIHQATSQMKKYLSGGAFSNNVTFVGISEEESSKIRSFIKKCERP